MDAGGWGCRNGLRMGLRREERDDPDVMGSPLR